MYCLFKLKILTLKKNIMNIINLENFKSVLSSTHRLELKTDFKVKKNGTLVVLSEEDILNDNAYRKLIGYSIDVLIIPKKYKYTFQTTPIYKNISKGFSKEFYLSFY